ncbi:hypothetical protein K432DRAFT_316218, partial [Lepidopterella palustris CBS 459.81]
SDRLPDPPIFTGKRKNLPTFLTKLQYKLEGNADRYPTERARLLYVHLRLEGDVVILINLLMDRDIHTKNFFVHFAEFRKLAADTGLNEIGLIT